MNKSIGGIELRSISKGIEVTDFMVKKAQVEIIYFRSICPGKFIALVSGNEGEVKVAIDYGVDLGQKYVVDSFVVNNVHEEIISSIKGKYIECKKGAIGIVETSSVCSGLQALDRVLKESNVTIVKIQLAFVIGGKFVFTVSGELSDIQNGIEVMKSIINNNKIINISIVPSPDDQILEFLKKWFYINFNFKIRKVKIWELMRLLFI